MSARRTLALCLDQGGHASRALIFDQRGRIVSRTEIPVRTLLPGPRRVEHMPRALLASVQHAAEAAMGKLSRMDRSRVRAAGLATQRSSLCCWDRETGQPLSRVLSWQDRRAVRMTRRLAGHAREIESITGLVLSPHYGASKFAWCLQHLPAVRRAARQGTLCMGPLAGFLLAGLLDEHPAVTDPVNGSRTLLLDLQSGQWSAELCRLFDIPVSALPQVVPNQGPFGHLVLRYGTIPMEVVTGDQPAALFAFGTPRPDTAYINIGTGAFVQTVVPDANPRIRGLLASTVWRAPGETWYAQEGTVNGAGSALTAMCKRYNLNERMLQLKLPGWLESPQTSLLFLNGIGGLGAPFWEPGFRSRFVGSGNVRERMVAVIESIVFLLISNLDRMREHGFPFRQILATGGLARLDGLCQRLSELSGLIVLRPTLPEATAAGLLHWLLPNHAPLDTENTLFHPRRDPALERRYSQWKDEMQAALKTSSMK